MIHKPKKMKLGVALARMLEDAAQGGSPGFPSGEAHRNRGVEERTKSFHEESAITKQTILERFNRMRNAAPETPIDVIPEIVDMPNRAASPDDGERECPVCRNIRFVVKNGNMEPCSACGVAQARRSSALAKYSSQSTRSESMTFQGYRVTNETREMYAATLRFSKNPDGWLCISGRRGIGKTHLCAALFNELNKKTGVIFVTGIDLMSSLKETFGNDEGDTTSEVMTRYKETPVLIIDDIGREKSGDWSRSVWFELLDYRYRNGMPTVLISNYDLGEEQDFMDAAITDRIAHVGFSKLIKVKAESYRRNPNVKEIGKDDIGDI